MPVKPIYRLAPWSGLLLLILAHGFSTWLWLSLDNRPPLWDMALHQAKGLAFHDYYLGNNDPLPDGWWAISGAYPPLYHHLLALAFLLGRHSHWAVWANLPATMVLAAFTFLLGRHWFSARAGLLASTMLLGFPCMAWISRETVIDYTLSAVVLLAIYLLRRAEGFTRRGPSLGFGIALAAAALTKWIGPVFLVLPVAWAWRRRPDSESGARLRNFLDAMIVALGISLVWYLPKLPEILEFLRRNAQIGAAEGEPPVFTVQSAIYYLRLLEGEQLQAAFFMLFLAGLCWGLKYRLPAAFPLLCWILSGYLGLTLLRTKDPRFTLPLLPAVALLAACWIDAISSRRLKALASALMVLLSCGHYCLASFGAGWLPEKVVLMKGYGGSFSWDWTLFSQSYQGLLGAPQIADWPHEEILAGVVGSSHASGRVRLGIIPDLPRFNHENLRLAAELRRSPVEVQRIGTLDAASRKQLAAMDFLVVAEGEQGMEWSTRANQQINEYIFGRPEVFQIQSFSRVPQGPALRIYRVVHP